jgi:hypothetical protein
VPVAVNEDAENCMERLPGKRSYEVLWETILAGGVTVTVR